MKEILKGIAVLALVAVFAYIGYKINEPSVSLGSIGPEPYQATTTDSTFASATAYTTLKTGFGTLGSVIVSSTTPSTALPPIRIYDSNTGTTTATTTLAVFGAGSNADGTYIYDVAFTDGLIVEVTPGFDGIFTITYK